MLKSVITTKITAVGTGQPNSAAEVRAITSDITDEVYGVNALTDTQATTHVITLVFAGGLYTATFTKMGIVVHVKMRYQNNSAITPTNTIIANFTNSEFAPANQQRLYGFNDGNNTVMPFSFEAGYIRNFKAIPITEEQNITGTYLTNP